ncbi:MSC_0623 family F1-like ATPase-associated protein [Mycoplasma sp. CSL10166]|uniref:MSC_0623 family F1-like ATPase-associated protein n=1 Tax=Mycoplasma sp. CSL10166 TaxID=2813825 RepID=UPI00197BD1CE|nr:DUF2714 domain-containing protein [Mycoplasma sp. CSL10166]MBN4084455.1 DUF2714 domain-containing protein [Mycoplasma sp. CSL10166]
MWKNKKKITPEQKQLFDLYANYKEKIKSDKYLSNSKIMATILLKNSLGFNSKEYKEFVANLDLAIKNRNDIIFRKFIINFNVNLKFSANVLVPNIVDKESSNDYSLNLTKSAQPNLQKLYDSLNSEIETLLNNGFVLEILPNTAFFIDSASQKLKVFFDKKFVVEI